MMASNGQATVPPGFRFHPTDEELLYYYLRKKVSYEAIDLDVIREVDLNKLEPWDLKDKCKIGSGPQNEWYFFSHKDKKYPTGTRTNRATMAGFWKATGRDKAIHLSSSRKIGMRKTLVFYTGRAPHGQKTDWIMHEYRLEDDTTDVQEDGWVVCRVFKKKNLRGFQAEVAQEQEDYTHIHHQPNVSNLDPKQNHHLQSLCNYNFECSMHLPQLFSPEAAAIAAQSFVSPISLTTNDIECSQNLLRLTSNVVQQHHQERFSGDWSFLDKLLASHQCIDQQNLQTKCYGTSSTSQVDAGASTHQRFSFQYLNSDADVLKFSK